MRLPSGFLRITGGKEPLDASSVHPEAYDVARKIVAACGRDIRSLSFASLRGAIGLVSQDVFLFHGSVRENIAYGTFDAALERASGATLVEVKRITGDQRPFKAQYDPSHPAADAQGMVKLPNVDRLVELADMKEANRSYQASLQIWRQARELHAMTLDLMKS